MTCPTLTQNHVHDMNYLFPGGHRRRCANCDGKGEYDPEKERPVEAMTYAVRFGRGPARRGEGVEVMCCCCVM